MVNWGTRIFQTVTCMVLRKSRAEDTEKAAGRASERRKEGGLETWLRENGFVIVNNQYLWLAWGFFAR